MNEKEFWNKKYANGGISGRGSIGVYRNWKWVVIRNKIGMRFRNIIDVGCGDLSFWEHPIANVILKNSKSYVGIDISDHIVERNKKNNPSMWFICAGSHEEQQGIRGDLVLVMDLLFHIMDEENFEKTLENICKYANQDLVVYTWKNNPFDNLNDVTDGRSQYYRRLGDYENIFHSNDVILEQFKDVPFDPYGRLYFFRRILY